MTPQSALRLPAPLKEEPRKKSPLIEEMPDRAGELSCPFEKGYLETQQRANSVRPYGGAYVPLEKAPVGCALCWDVPKGQGDYPSGTACHLPFQGRLNNSSALSGISSIRGDYSARPHLQRRWQSAGLTKEFRANDVRPYGKVFSSKQTNF